MNLPVWVSGFCTAITGLALAGIGAAWGWHLPWLLAVSLLIGAEEILESSVILVALQWRNGATQQYCRGIARYAPTGYGAGH